MLLLSVALKQLNLIVHIYLKKITPQPDSWTDKGTSIIFLLNLKNKKNLKLICLQICSISFYLFFVCFNHLSEICNLYSLNLCLLLLLNRFNFFVQVPNGQQVFRLIVYKYFLFFYFLFIWQPSLCIL